MSQSFFKLRCPHCKHESSGSCGGLGIIGQEVTLCQSCGKPFATAANSYGWSDGETSSSERRPKHPSKGLDDREMKIAENLLAQKAEAERTKHFAMPEKGEQLYVFRNGQYVPAKNP